MEPAPAQVEGEQEARPGHQLAAPRRQAAAAQRQHVLRRARQAQSQKFKSQSHASVPICVPSDGNYTEFIETVS